MTATNGVNYDAETRADKVGLQKLPVPLKIFAEAKRFGLSPRCVEMLATALHRYCHNPGQYFAFSTKLCDRMYNATRRKEFIRFLDQCPQITVCRTHNQHQNSIWRSITGVAITHTTHKKPAFSTSLHKDGFALVNRFVGSVVYVEVDVREVVERLDRAAKMLGWDQWDKDAKKGCDGLEFGDVSEDVFGELAVKRLNENSDWTLEQLADHYRKQWVAVSAAPSDGMRRKTGRLYSRLNQLPRELRRYITANGERMVCVDIKSCWWFVLATMLPEGEERRAILELIREGSFYSAVRRCAVEACDDEVELNALNTITGTNKDLKAAVNQFCLFGPIRFHALWRGLKALAPGLADLIARKRNQPGGATRLAHELMQAEGAVMLDIVARWLADNDEPFYSLHDGVAVRESIAEKVRQVIQAAAALRWGAVPGVGIDC